VGRKYVAVENEEVLKLFLVGPSDKIKEYDLKKIEGLIDEGFQTFCYTGALSYFHQIKLPPNYFSFFDPATFGSFYHIFNSDFFNNTRLVIPNLYEESLKLFSQFGYTCRKFQRSKRKYKEFKKLDFLNNFDGVISPTPEKVTSLGAEDLAKADWTQNYFLFNSGVKKKGKGARLNVDKFSCVVLPLIFNVFPNLQEIKIIGFGDFEDNRYGKRANARTGYGDYKSTFNGALPMLANNLALRKIKLHFVHSNFYSKAIAGFKECKCKDSIVLDVAPVDH